MIITLQNTISSTLMKKKLSCKMKKMIEAGGNHRRFFYLASKSITTRSVLGWAWQVSIKPRFISSGSSA